MYRKKYKKWDRDADTNTKIKEDSLFLLDLSSERCPLKNPVLLQCSLRKGIHSDNYAADIFQIHIIRPFYICIWCVPYFLLENQKTYLSNLKAQKYDGYPLLFKFLADKKKVIVWDLQLSFHRPDEFIPILRGAESWR